MSTSRPLLKLRSYRKLNAKGEAYGNSGIPETVSNIGDTLDYILSSLFPNARDAVATENDLPLTGNTLNDYRIVNDYNNSGQAAGYRWTQQEGQASPQWNLVQMFDSMDSILQQWETNASGLYVNQNGQPGGQTIHGSTDANEDLTLSANSGDGSNDPALQTGHIRLFSNTAPTANNVFNLGTVTEQFASIYLAGVLSDGTATMTVSEGEAAYDHSQITSSNPHLTEYAQVLSRIGALTVSGDITTEVVDLSTGGDKTLSITITDNSHNHVASNITDFDDASWQLTKSRLVDTGDANWTFDDALKTASLTVTLDTSSITDIASPAANKVLVGNIAGDEWITSDGTVELSGDITGGANYNSTTDKVEIATTTINTPLSTVDRIDLENLVFTAATGNPAVFTLPGHGLVSGRLINVFNSRELDGEHVVTRIDNDTFSIPIENTGGLDTGYIIPNGSQLLYDTTADSYCVKLENAQLSHNEITGLDSDDHLQYHNVNGRADSTTNKVTGGSTDFSNLYLRSNTTSNRGFVSTEDSIRPESGASYSGGNWEGLDLGTDANPFRDVHVRGELKGLRLEEEGVLPIANIQTKGRILQLPNGDIYFNKDGITYKRLMEYPDLSGQAGKALVVNGSEDGFDFTEVSVIASDSQVGELTGIDSVTAKTISAPANAIGILLQADDGNSDSIRVAWGSATPTASTGYEMIPSDTIELSINSNVRVIAEAGSANKVSYTWKIK